MTSEFSRRGFLRTAGVGIVALGGGLALPRSVRAAERERADAIAKITAVASGSAIAGYAWSKRGKAPAGYVKGMALSFAQVSHDLASADAYAVEMAKAATDDATKDALRHYADVFRQAGMDDARAGADTLRRLFVLMLGLGMRESSGRYCEGRDRSAQNTSAETAEAGLFQTSFNARRASPLLPTLFEETRTKPTDGFKGVFEEGVRPREGDLEDYGDGDGREFQRLSKACPFFAVRFAAIGLRNVRKHWGPINRREAEVRPEADAMFRDVRELVERDKLGPLL